MSNIDRYMKNLEPELERYEVISQFLTQEERDYIEDLREKREAGKNVAYGHDLVSAIARGHKRRAGELADALLEQCRLSHSYGRPPSTDQYAEVLKFTLTATDS